MGGRPRSKAFQPRTVTLIDTSAWTEFLQNTGTSVCNLVDELLAEEVPVCDAVRMEVLAGERDDSNLLSLRRLLALAVVIPTRATDYDDAAALYRRCRQRGETVRRLVARLTASAAILKPGDTGKPEDYPARPSN